MQANISVIVSAEGHARAGTAGRTISAAPFSPQKPMAARVADLAAALKDAQAVEATAAADYAKADAALLAAAAAADHIETELATAEAAAGTDTEPLEPHVTVLFDADSLAVNVPVSALREL